MKTISRYAVAAAFLLVGDNCVGGQLPDSRQLKLAGAITTSGEITGNETWSGRVFLTGDIIIKSTGSVTILPGTRIECDPLADDQVAGLNASRIEIIVDGGTLNAVGTEAQPIVFTPALGLHPDGAARGDWYGLRTKAGKVTLRYCIEEYGKEGLRAEGGDATVEHCTFQLNEGNGVVLTASMTLSSSTVHTNGAGISVAPGKTLTIDNSTVVNNPGNGIEGDANVSNSVVSRNGKAGIISTGGTIVVSNSFVQDNGGWGIGVWPTGRATIVGSVISGNARMFTGGPWEERGHITNPAGIAVGKGVATVRNSSVTNNAGSGILASWLVVAAGTWSYYTASGRGSATVEDSIVSGNGSVGVGGGYLVVGGETSPRAEWVPADSVVVVRSTIAHNGATAIYASTTRVAGSTITENGECGIDTATTTVTESTISNNRDRGILLTLLASEGLTGNAISHNKIGIEVNCSATKLEGITGNDVYGNLDYEIKNIGPAAINAKTNYWGEPTTSELENGVVNLTKIWDSRDDPAVGQVAVRPWSTNRFFKVTPPSITVAPESKVAVLGSSVSLSVTASGTAPLAYQWRKEGTNLLARTDSTLSLSNVRFSDAGNYDVVVTNSAGSVTSVVATLVVNPPPGQPIESVFPPGPPPHSGSLFVSLKPAAAAGQWRFVWEPIWRDGETLVGSLAGGNYDIEFKPVAGFIQPPYQTVPVTSGALSAVTNYYILAGAAPVGGLTVTIQPASVGQNPQLNSRGQWRRQGETVWHDSGETITNLNAGVYLVEFKAIADRVTPPSRSVTVFPNQANSIAATYLVGDSPTGTKPAPLLFLDIITRTNDAYAYNGQILSEVGYGSGFVVKERVVLTAAHVLFNDGSLAYVTAPQWFFQRHQGAYEPKPQTPRGWYVFEGYAAQRSADNTPGQSSPAAQNLDVAALFFLEPAARGGYGGFLPSGADNNEWLLSSRDKVLLGYPMETVPESDRGKMHGTVPLNVNFHRVTGQVYATSEVTSYPGNSGGPICVRFDSGKFYPVAVYLGGSAQTVVRAIDSQATDLINRAEISANGGGNSVGGGVNLLTSTLRGSNFLPGLLSVNLGPPAAVQAGAGWRIVGGDPTYHTDGPLALLPATYTVEFKPLPNYTSPTNRAVQVTTNQTTTVEATYSLAGDAPLLSFDRLAGLSVAGVAGRTYRVEYTDNLNPVIRWTALTTNTLSNGSFQIQNTSPTNAGTRFYRAVLVP